MINNNNCIAIVAGRNYTTRLTLSRSAGMAGCDVVLIQTDHRKSHVQKIDRCSNYIVQYHLCPEPHEDLLIHTILNYKNCGKKVVILPADDYVAYVVDKNLYLLASLGFLTPNVENKQGGVLKIMDKSYQKTIAQNAGMNVAEGWICVFKEGAYSIPEEVAYPCFTKPIESYDGALKNHLRRCENEEDLKKVLNNIPKNYHHPILVEQYIAIDREYGVQGVSINGKVFMPAIVFKDKSNKGLTASGVIRPITSIPNLKEQLTKFMKDIQFTGIFDIDLFGSNGVFYFNELNVRLGANGFALTYGVGNVPGLFIKYMLGQEDVLYDGPIDFKPLTFASEKVIRDMYFDGLLSLKDYKQMLCNSDILSLKFDGDMGPYKEFAKLDKILPLWRLQRVVRKMLKVI